jgi:O-methyltransferase involved in polyketide biosynthesis
MPDPDNSSSLRTTGDSWAITELVGATALAVAAGRAVETAGPNPLIRDDFAWILVSSAGPAWAQLADAELAWLDGDQHGQRVYRLGCDYHAVCTHFFDEYFGNAVPEDLADEAVRGTLLRARLGELSN